jgi:hypothetical protein
MMTICTKVGKSRKCAECKHGRPHLLNDNRNERYDCSPSTCFAGIQMAGCHTEPLLAELAIHRWKEDRP